MIPLKFPVLCIGGTGTLFRILFLGAKYIVLILGLFCLFATPASAQVDCGDLSTMLNTPKGNRRIDPRWDSLVCVEKFFHAYKSQCASASFGGRPCDAFNPTQRKQLKRWQSELYNAVSLLYESGVDKQELNAWLSLNNIDPSKVSSKKSLDRAYLDRMACFTQIFIRWQGQNLGPVMNRATKELHPPRRICGDDLVWRDKPGVPSKKEEVRPGTPGGLVKRDGTSVYGDPDGTGDSHKKKKGKPGGKPGGQPDGVPDGEFVGIPPEVLRNVEAELNKETSKHNKEHPIFNNSIRNEEDALQNLLARPDVKKKDVERLLALFQKMDTKESIASVIEMLAQRSSIIEGDANYVPYSFIEAVFLMYADKLPKEEGSSLAKWASESYPEHIALAAARVSALYSLQHWNLMNGEPFANKKGILKFSYTKEDADRIASIFDLAFGRDLPPTEAELQRRVVSMRPISVNINAEEPMWAAIMLLITNTGKTVLADMGVAAAPLLAKAAVVTGTVAYIGYVIVDAHGSGVLANYRNEFMNDLSAAASVEAMPDGNSLLDMEDNPPLWMTSDSQVEAATQVATHTRAEAATRVRSKYQKNETCGYDPAKPEGSWTTSQLSARLNLFSPGSPELKNLKSCIINAGYAVNENQVAAGKRNVSLAVAAKDSNFTACFHAGASLSGMLNIMKQSERFVKQVEGTPVGQAFVKGKLIGGTWVLEAEIQSSFPGEKDILRMLVQSGKDFIFHMGKESVNMITGNSSFRFGRHEYNPERPNPTNPVPDPNMRHFHWEEVKTYQPASSAAKKYICNHALFSSKDTDLMQELMESYDRVRGSGSGEEVFTIPVP